MAFDYRKYRPFAFAPQSPRDFQRTWPDKTLTRAPRWVSVDLRDGNQALIDPMTIDQKLRFFKLLVDMGFKEIEIGFPSASQIEFDFTRRLIEEKLIPDDVTVQVLVQSRQHLIDRTFEALQGVKQAVVHLYNPTSRVQREKVYEKSRAEIIAIACFGAELLKERAAQHPGSRWIFEYSPESFSQTEPDFAVEVCEAVAAIWQPGPEQEVIFNLPNTVESATANVYADQIEYFCQHFSQRDRVSISIHTHNDRGGAVAAAELAVLAGADRVEGTLLGNGERTGNMDIMVMAMNLYAQGIDPGLDFSRMNQMVQIVSECNNLPVHPRHPYVGELVFTAFSGSHQDAIKKSLEKPHNGVWDIAYLPIDPLDIGRSYQDVVRINSQSGKGGVAYILARDHGLHVPRWLQIDFAQLVQRESERTQKELSSADILRLFQDSYMGESAYQLEEYNIKRQTKFDAFAAVLSRAGERFAVSGKGNGALSSFINGLETLLGRQITVLNYSEHALTKHTDAQAVAYVQLLVGEDVHTGIAYSHDTLTAVLRATLVALTPALAN